MTRKFTAITFWPILAAILVAGASPALATTFAATLSGANERPTPVVTDATGFGRLVLAADRNSFTVNIEFSGLSANAVAGHVHCCSGPDANSAVAIGFSPPPATSGTIAGSFDLLNAATYSPGFFNGVGGGSVTGARSAFLSGLSGGLAYFNVHTANFPGGEIRGQLAAVPEPGSWALMITGFGLVGFAMRRRTTALQPVIAG